MMTSADFEVLAEVVKQAGDGAVREELAGVERFMWILVGKLNAEYPRFDSEKFMEACGYGSSWMK
jgi:hypothetical protein